MGNSIEGSGLSGDSKRKSQTELRSRGYKELTELIDKGAASTEIIERYG